MSLSFSAVDSRGINTSSTSFDIPTISFLFWVYPTAYDFGTIFGADENNNAIWIHMDGGNTGISFRYLRSIERGQWVIGFNNPITLNNWYCVALSYDRSSTSANPTFYLRRFPSQSALSYETSEQIRIPDGDVNIPNPGYHLGATPTLDFPFSGLLYGFQVWNRIVTSAEFEQASLNPGAVTNGLILNLSDVGIDLSLSAGDVVFTSVGVSANPSGIPVNSSVDFTVSANTLSASYSLLIPDILTVSNTSISLDVLSASFSNFDLQISTDNSLDVDIVSASYLFLSPSIQTEVNNNISLDVLSASYSLLSNSVLYDFTVSASVLSASYSIETPNINFDCIIDVGLLSGSQSLLIPSIQVETGIDVSVGLLSGSYFIPNYIINAIVEYVDLNVTSRISLLGSPGFNNFEFIDDGNSYPNVLSASYSIETPTILTTSNVTIEAGILSASYVEPNHQINVDTINSVELISASYSIQPIQVNYDTTIDFNVLSASHSLIDPQVNLDFTITNILLSASYLNVEPNIVVGDSVTLQVDIISASHSLIDPQVNLDYSFVVDTLSAFYNSENPQINTDLITLVDVISSSYLITSPQINYDFSVVNEILSGSFSILNPIIQTDGSVIVNVDVLSSSYSLQSSQLSASSIILTNILSGAFEFQNNDINTNSIINVNILNFSASLLSLTFGNNLVMKIRRIEGY